MISIVLFLWACGVTTKAECDEETPCAFGEECIEGQCMAQTCATSNQCAIEQFCNDDHTCEAGCKEDTDCKFGDLCDSESKTCVQSECTDTHLDCGFGEFCSPAGECYDAGGYYCQDCEEAGDCGGNGNECIWGYCSTSCDDGGDRDCPAGFDCIPSTDGTGNITGHWCVASCWLMEGRE